MQQLWYVVLGLILPTVRSFLTDAIWRCDKQSPQHLTHMHASIKEHAEAGQLDLLIIGAGTLGSIIGQLWKKQHGDDAQVWTETSSAGRHKELMKLGLIPSVRANRAALTKRQYSNIVFCVPPSSEEDYVAEVQSATNLWSGTGAFVFTSSGGVFSEDGGGIVSEISPISSSPRMARILGAERAVLAKGGIVLRLAGLYTASRGPQSFWLARGEVTAAEEGLINLLHYEDAARATIAAIMSSSKITEPRILLISDDRPITRRQICEIAAASPMYRGKAALPKFKVQSNTDPPSLGKVYDTSRSRRLLSDWRPRHRSFAEFMASAEPSARELETIKGR